MNNIADVLAIMATVVMILVVKVEWLKKRIDKLEHKSPPTENT